jgi:hypothetical protein
VDIQSVVKHKKSVSGMARVQRLMANARKEDKTDYIVRAALAEDTNDGWVWICGPSSKHLRSRTVVKMRCPNRCRSVYTEVRKIDHNFIQKYNQSPRIPIVCERDTIVMAEWYRRALGINDTTELDNNTGTVQLIVTQTGLLGWRSIRAACHHPDPVVRLGTRLGLLGAWLGFLGAWLGLLGACDMPRMALQIGFGFLGFLAVAGVWAGWGPPRPAIN